MFTDILWRFLILETFVLGALCSTSCPERYPQEWFCSHDFVLKMRARNLIKVAKGYRYKMEILKVFRGDREQLNITDNRYVHLETERWLRPTTYLVYAQNKNGLLYSGACSSSFSWWNHLPEFEKLALSRYYGTGCDCIGEIGALLGIGGLDHCKSVSSFMKKVDEDCKWVETPELKYCRILYRPFVYREKKRY